MTDLELKGEVFRALHQRAGAFIMPNPWDSGSARMLHALGFEALATTSAGFAHSLGHRDGGVTLTQKIAHCTALAAATPLPLSADLENGFADAPELVARNVIAVAASGIVGASIEDYTGDPASPIYDFNLAVERIQAVAEAVHGLPYPFTLTARAENLLRGVRDLDDTLRRLVAYGEAGADVLFAPGLATLAEVRSVVAALNRPVNVLAPMVKGVTVAQLAEVGVKRVSIGGALARAATTAFLGAARKLRESGSLEWTAGLASLSEVEKLFD